MSEHSRFGSLSGRVFVDGGEVRVVRQPPDERRSSPPKPLTIVEAPWPERQVREYRDLDEYRKDFGP